MLYVQQSLSPDEEILMAARFHWMYTFKAVMWIVFGISMGIAIVYGSVWWELGQEIRASYPDLPPELYMEAQSEMVKHHGGYMHVLWGLHPGIRIATLGSFVLGLFLFANMMIIKATTEIAVTSDRLVYKRGLIARHVGEISIDRIEGVTVLQGVLGRIFGYGRVSVRGMGVGEVILPPIETPIEFRKAVQEARVVKERGERISNEERF